MQNNVQLRLDDVTLSQSRIHQPAASPPSHFALYTDLGRSNKAVMLTLCSSILLLMFHLVCNCHSVAVSSKVYREPPCCKD